MNSVESIIEADISDISSKKVNKSEINAAPVVPDAGRSLLASIKNIQFCGDIHFKPFSEIHVAVNKCYIFQNFYTYIHLLRMSIIFIPVS